MFAQQYHSPCAWKKAFFPSLHSANVGTSALVCFQTKGRKHKQNPKRKEILKEGGFVHRVHETFPQKSQQSFWKAHHRKASRNAADHGISFYFLILEEKDWKFNHNVYLPCMTTWTTRKNNLFTLPLHISQIIWEVWYFDGTGLTENLCHMSDASLSRKYLMILLVPTLHHISNIFKIHVFYLDATS